MPDAYIQDLERRYKASPSKGAARELLIARLRSGLVTKDQLWLAAYCGSTAAALAIGSTGGVPPQTPKSFCSWTKGMEEFPVGAQVKALSQSWILLHALLPERMQATSSKARDLMQGVRDGCQSPSTLVEALQNVNPLLKDLSPDTPAQCLAMSLQLICGLLVSVSNVTASRNFAHYMRLLERLETLLPSELGAAHEEISAWLIRETSTQLLLPIPSNSDPQS